jgi:Fur family peroxide stress response transcriptional regulator
MTLKYFTVQPSEKEIEHLIKNMMEISKQKGVKVTTQRILIFKELLKRTKEHPSAEEIYESLKNKIYGLSLSTVYRALATFEELGLVRRIPTPDGKAHFEIATIPHNHFICKNCGKILDIDIDKTKLIQNNQELEDFKIESCNVICYGICKNCINKLSN